MPVSDISTSPTDSPNDKSCDDSSMITTQSIELLPPKWVKYPLHAGKNILLVLGKYDNKTVLFSKLSSLHKESPITFLYYQEITCMLWALENKVRCLFYTDIETLFEQNPKPSLALLFPRHSPDDALFLHTRNIPLSYLIPDYYFTLYPSPRDYRRDIPSMHCIASPIQFIRSYDIFTGNKFILKGQTVLVKEKAFISQTLLSRKFEKIYITVKNC
jgi:hypothetical protein